MRLLSDDELAALRPAETAAFPGPVPTQVVSSDEYFPSPQSAEQRRVEARLAALGDARGAPARDQPARVLPDARAAWRRPSSP